jgi:hypothetical protein
MAIGACTNTIIVVFHDDGLLAGIPAGEKDHDLPGLHGQADASAGAQAGQAAWYNTKRCELAPPSRTLRNFTILATAAAPSCHGCTEKGRAKALPLPLAEENFSGFGVLGSAKAGPMRKRVVSSMGMIITQTVDDRSSGIKPAPQGQST